MKKKVIIEFICYSPRIYSGFDKYNLLVAQKLIINGFQPVFVFSDSTDAVPELARDLISVGVLVEIIPSTGKLDIFKSIWKLYAKYRPELVHTHFVEYIKALTAAFSLLFGARHFTSFHSTISSLSTKEFINKKGIVKRIMLFLYYQFLVICSSKILTVSNAISNQFSDFSNSQSTKIQTLYLGVDLRKNIKSKDELTQMLGLDQTKILLCNISAFEYIKGIDIWCEAVSILKHTYKLENFQFCHLGGLRTEDKVNFDYREYIYSLTRELEIQDMVLWLGHRNDIGDILSAFDIYVHPSRMEGIGMVNMEAAAQGLPIVATNVGGIPEIVIDGVNGFLVESDNSTQLARKLLELLSNKELIKSMGTKSYQIASLNFDINKQSSNLVENYFNSI